MTTLINGLTKQEIALLRTDTHELVASIRENSKSDAYLAQELLVVLQACLIAEPRLRFLVMDEAIQYSQRASK